MFSVCLEDREEDAECFTKEKSCDTETVVEIILKGKTSMHNNSDVEKGHEKMMSGFSRRKVMRDFSLTHNRESWGPVLNS
jgi:hypothetical protein